MVREVSLEFLLNVVRENVGPSRQELPNLRVLLGLALLSLTVLGPKTLWGLVDLVPLLTGLARYCPLYHLLGLKTCPLTPSSQS